jgi:hypothetical protein
MYRISKDTLIDMGILFFIGGWILYDWYTIDQNKETEGEGENEGACN